MSNFIFYSATILIWGSTWLAIKYQLGLVDPMLSVAYRFTIAAVILLLWCLLVRLPMRFSRRDHLFIAMQGMFLFALNYLLFYIAELHITSGLAAVVFSTIVIMNLFNGALFLKTPVEIRVLAGGGLGLVGLGFLFWPELTAFNLSDQGLYGLLLCFAATYLASLGNIVSARNQQQKLPVVQTNAYGMSYGALIMFLIVWGTNTPLVFDTSPDYLMALVYLALFGSVVAFGCYLTLIGRVGVGRAAYVTLLFPVVALGISTLAEGYQWSFPALAGLALILGGNGLAMIRPELKAS
jgi:drug/metabolite transporter (DMT)-like permease